METKRKHVPTWLYKLGGRLDKQYGEIVSALSDINAFNAGKKRDKALELVAAWLPEVEKFSKEIGRQQAYIDSLKEQIGQEADYAGRMRDEKYEQELKVQKANQRIFELQRTNEQMGRLLFTVFYTCSDASHAQFIFFIIHSIAAFSGFFNFLHKF